MRVIKDKIEVKKLTELTEDVEIRLNADDVADLYIDNNGFECNIYSGNFVLIDGEVILHDDCIVYEHGGDVIKDHRKKYDISIKVQDLTIQDIENIKSHLDNLKYSGNDKFIKYILDM